MPAAKPTFPVLALNSGSSSLKFGLFRVGASSIEAILTGEAESIGGDQSRFRAQDSNGAHCVSEEGRLAGPREVIERVARLFADRQAPAPVAVGHRIVHGGSQLRQHCLIDAAVLRQLEAACGFAPLHGPAALAVMGFAQELFPGIAHAACLDTVFHAGLPDVARVLPLPRELQAQGVQRYGFHGLSCESVVRQLGQELPGRLVIAHLGNGASVTAVKRGRSIDTSMGLTPTGGIIMGTRCGDLDPGVLLYLAREKKLDAARLEDLVDHRSGLLGISGLSSDMRRLREAAASNADARLAVQMFCYSVRKQIAAMIAVLDGADLLVFTGGIGENDAAGRSAICGGLSWLGIIVDAARNRSVDNPISTPASRCAVRVLRSKEDAEIARHAWELATRAR